MPAQPSGAPAERGPTAYSAGQLLWAFVLGALLSAVLLGAVLLLMRRPEPPAIALQPPPTVEPTATPAPSPTPAPLTVYVSGAVRTPGNYTLPAGARVADAIAAAGGTTDAAEGASVNQAELLRDGGQVHVPAAVGVGAASAPLPAPGLSGGMAQRALQPDAPGGGGLINLNSASATELETLPGIGPTKAQAIIEGRPYAAVDELSAVPGIGEATLAELRPLVTAP